MKEEITVKLSNRFINDFQDSRKNKAQTLIEELSNEMLPIQNLLIGYHYAEAGQVNNPAVKSDSIAFKNTQSGFFVVEYEVHYFMACSDNRYDSRSKMTIQFEIFPDKHTIQLTGEEIRERLPDEF